MKDLKRTRVNRGFTLIELLVVIAIIAILAAILFPVFAQAREKARQISCASNMKQMSLACLMYTEDADEKFPTGFGTYGASAGAPLAGTNYSWPIEIAPYTKSLGVFMCPDDSGAGKVSASEGTSISYAANGEMWADWGHSRSPSTMHLVGPMGFASGVWDLDYPCPGWNVSSCAAPGASQDPIASLTLAKVPLPDTSIMLAEVWSSDIKRVPSGTWWEADSANYPAGVSGNDVIDQNQIGGIPNPNNSTPGYPNDVNGIVSAHGETSIDVGGLTNFAFCDGHVKALLPTKTHPNGWNTNNDNMWDCTRNTSDPYSY